MFVATGPLGPATIWESAVFGGRFAALHLADGTTGLQLAVNVHSLEVNQREGTVHCQLYFGQDFAQSVVDGAIPRCSQFGVVVRCDRRIGVVDHRLGCSVTAFHQTFCGIHC